MLEREGRSEDADGLITGIEDARCRVGGMSSFSWCSRVLPGSAIGAPMLGALGLLPLRRDLGPSISAKLSESRPAPEKSLLKRSSKPSVSSSAVCCTLWKEGALIAGSLITDGARIRSSSSIAGVSS